MSKDIKRYLGYTFAFTWLLWGIVVIANRFNLLQYGTPLSMIFLGLGALMPPICAILVKTKYSTKEDFKGFIKSIINPKHHIIRYIFVIGLAFTYCFLPTFFGGTTLERPLYIAIVVFPVMIIGGGLEEIGWRGFLQPAFQKKFSPFISTLIVSIIWTVWHLPLWFMEGSHQASWSLLYFSITVTALSFLLAVIHSTTKSVFLCIIFHTFINSFWEVFVPNDQLLSACIMLVFAFIIFMVYEYIRNKPERIKVNNDVLKLQ